MPTLAEEFAQFWAAYPSRVGKLAAQQEYVKARKHASAEDIVAGVLRYVAGKPEWKEWCNPKTFLHQGRWMDEYDAPVVQPVKVDWFDECKALHNGECIGDRWKHHLRKQMEQTRGEAQIRRVGNG